MSASDVVTVTSPASLRQDRESDLLKRIEWMGREVSSLAELLIEERRMKSELERQIEALVGQRDRAMASAEAARRNQQQDRAALKRASEELNKLGNTLLQSGEGHGAQVVWKCVQMMGGHK